MELEQIDEIVKQKLSEKRYKHSLAVMQRCAELAVIYGVDIEKAKKVGLAHDIAKELSQEDSIEIANEESIEFDEIELHNTALWHAKIGTSICKKEFGFSEEMAKAVENHTLGSENMSMLDKILFVADATGLDRDWNDLEYARKMSETSLDEVIIYIININIKDNIERKRQIHPKSIIARNQLLNNLTYTIYKKNKR